MYKRIDKHPLTLKFWSDGTGDKTISTATHLVIRNNQPGDPETQNETDYFVINQDKNIAYLYGKSMFVRKDAEHAHYHYSILTDHFDDIETDQPAEEGDVQPYIANVLESKGYTIRLANPDDFNELGLDVAVPRSTNDLDRHALEGYGFNVQTGVPVITFLVDQTASPPAKWMTPLSHLINYTWREDGRGDGTQRFGVMNNHNEIIGGWSGEAAIHLIRALAEHEEFEIAIREVPPAELPTREQSPGVEPDVLGEIDYEASEPQYQQVDDSDWSDYRNEDGVTMQEMWEENYTQ